MKYDAIIIGSGQGGNPLSYRLAELGWQVALIERANVGGTCINTGCTPTKTMVHRAQIAHYARNAARWGVHAENVTRRPSGNRCAEKQRRRSAFAAEYKRTIELASE